MSMPATQVFTALAMSALCLQDLLLLLVVRGVALVPLSRNTDTDAYK